MRKVSRMGLIPSNKFIFITTGLLMILLGVWLLWNSIKVEKIIKSNNKIEVGIDEIEESRKYSKIVFNIYGERHFIRLSNKTINRDGINDTIELYHLPNYPNIFIYKYEPTKFSFAYGSFLIVVGLFILVRGIIKSNLSLLNLQNFG